METTREQIILAIISKMAVIHTTAGYNTDCGANVQRAIGKLDPEALPACVVWPKSEEAGRQYGSGVHVMPVQVESLALPGTVNPSVVSELMLGDLIEAMAGIVWSLPFTSGGTYEIKVGDTITGATGSATGYVTGVTLSSGTWAGGDAAGALTFRRLTGAFQAENLKVGAQTNVATIAGATTGVGPIDTTTAGLADDIEYTGGGMNEYPGGGDQAVGVVTRWNIKYRALNGDPYHQ